MKEFGDDVAIVGASVPAVAPGALEGLSVWIGSRDCEIKAVSVGGGHIPIRKVTKNK